MTKLVSAWAQVGQNIFKTYVIMFVFSLFFVAVVYILARAFGVNQFGGFSIFGFAIIAAGISNFISYYYSDSIVLGMVGAVQITKEDAPQIYNLVENLCISGGLPLPKIYVSPDPTPNAFATGRDPKHAAICFNQGILDRLSKLELEGVAAHELSHVGNRDTLVSSVVAILVGTLAILSDFFMRSLWFRSDDREDRNGNIFMILGIIVAILSPIIATMIQLAISRRRELLADASGVIMTRNPAGLESALIKISSDKNVSSTATNGTAHMYIVNPFRGKSMANWVGGLFNTHPSLEERLKALEAMEGRV